MKILINSKKIYQLVVPLLIISFVAGGFASFPKSTHAAGFSFYRSITILHGQVPNTDQPSFPVLISGTYDGTGGIADLRTAGSGGKVQNASGFDVGFYTNSDCSTGKMAWETETYTASTGVVNYWVDVASVSHLSDTVFYMCYGNSSISTDQSNKTAVWDSNYQVVYHLPDGSTLSANDSTGNVNNGALTGTTAAVAGQIGGAANISDSGKIGVTSISLAGGVYTISTWFNTPLPTGSDGYETLVRGNSDHPVLVQNSTSQELGEYDNVGSTQFHGSGFHMTSLASGWHYLAAATSGTNTNFYIDGSFVGSSNIRSTDNILFVGNYQGDGHQPWGLTDEVRISTGISRSADWIAAEFNNQSSPSTFYTVGSETSLGGSLLSTPSRTMRLFAGFKIKLISGKIKLLSQ